MIEAAKPEASKQGVLTVVLSPMATKLLLALRKLEQGYRPHPCGGFTTDDMEWRLGIAFSLQEELDAALEELQARKLIRYAGYDEEDGIGHCYETI